MLIRISLTALLLAGCIICLSLVVTQSDPAPRSTPVETARMIAQSGGPSTNLQ